MIQRTENSGIEGVSDRGPMAETTIKADVHYDTFSTVVKSRSFRATRGGGNIEVVMDFSRIDDLVPVYPSSFHANINIPPANLPDLALIYAHAKEVFDFARNKLLVSNTLSTPLVIRAFSTANDAPYSHYHPSNHPVFQQFAHQVHLLSTDSTNVDSANNKDRERARTIVWHEMFHELMDRTIGMTFTPENAHGGYANISTIGSWQEGWAEFFPLVLADRLGLDQPFMYPDVVGKINLEKNIQVWDYDRLREREEEEFAVASLLWDLYDPVNGEDKDPLQIPLPTLWQAIINNTPQDMKAVYDALVSSNIGQYDLDGNGIKELDEVFITHGFFYDANTNKKYNAGEEVGRAAPGKGVNASSHRR